MRTFAVTSLVLALLGCPSTPAIVPPSGPGTAYPCGLTSHTCGNQLCCWNDYDCGGITPGCPELQCCYSGPDDLPAGAARRPKMVAMWREGEEPKR